MDDRNTEYNYDPPRVSTIQGSGNPITDVFGEPKSQVVLNVNLLTCEYNFGFTPTINVTETSGGGTTSGPMDIGGVRSGNRPISGPSPTLGGSAYFPAHSTNWGITTGGEAYFPLGFGLEMFFTGIATEDNAGSAHVIWSFAPASP
jgi:hypothetical protein